MNLPAKFRHQCRALFWLVIFSVLLAAPAPAQAQNTCSAPSAIPVAAGDNIFTPQQESDLGDVVAEQLERTSRPIDDPELTSHIAAVAARLLQQLPETHLHFRFFLFDLPVANAYSLPGGRIYVSRKMVGFLRNDDELASLLAHEIGHIVSHQLGVRFTQLFRQVLGVTQVTDRRDIFEKYNRLLDAAIKSSAFERLARMEEPNQYQADQIALLVLGSASYSPLSFADFFDRFAQTKGRTGGFFSDFFGVTRPEEKRLREMRKALTDLPAACRAISAATVSGDFTAWQAAVIAYSGLGHRETLHGLLSKLILDPPLRSDVIRLHFSPDGLYVLAQDESSIFVLSRQPFAVLFSIDAPGARPAQFTPDSKSVVFCTTGLRIEEWSIAQQKRIVVHDLVVRNGCTQTQLSPDGRVLACLNFALDLSLIDVASGTAFFTRPAIFQRTVQNQIAQFLRLLDIVAGRDWAQMHFSPDGKYFVGARQDVAVVVDLTTRKTIPVHGALNDILGYHFSFLDAGRIIGSNGSAGKTSGIASFPSGEWLSRFRLGAQALEAPTRGNFVLLRPITNAPLGVMDLETHKIIAGAKKSAAADIYDHFLLLEKLSGEVGMFEMPSGRLVSQAQLPLSPLGTLRTASISDDFGWLAVSERTRGAVWNLSTGQRTQYLRGFQAAFLDHQNMYADFPKIDAMERNLATIDLAGAPPPLGKDLEHRDITQYGRFLVEKEAVGKDGDTYTNVAIKVHDVRESSGLILWSRIFPKDTPEIHISPELETMIFEWPTDSGSAKDEIKKDPALDRKFSALKDKKAGRLLEVLNVATGKRLGAVLLDSAKASIMIGAARADGNWLVLPDSQNRLLLYSLSAGEKTGDFFGAHPVLSAAAGALGVENGLGEFVIYDLKSAATRDKLKFPSAVAMAQFSADGERLFVLTKDQTAYIFETKALTASPTPEPSAP
jgi:Peptidase family M48